MLRRLAVSLASALVILVIALLAALSAAYLMPLPPATSPAASEVLDRDGELVARLFVENRLPVGLEQVPTALRDAVVATEDAAFYRHPGFNPLALARAAYRNIRAGRVVEGGSTITQQLAKNRFNLGAERTISRKLREALLTLRLEAAYSKDQILEMYLNEIYMGHGVYGAQAASLLYFGKPVAKLSLGESALLAGLIRSPENYSPYRNAHLAAARRWHVLGRMVETGYISEREAALAGQEEIVLAGVKPDIPRKAPYYVDYVVGQVTARYPDVARDLYSGGYTIHTSLDLTLQRWADELTAQYMPRLDRGDSSQDGVPQPQVALVALEAQTGCVLAMVGGRDYAADTTNRAVAARRQPGSAFKPFVYVAALHRGYTAADTQDCEFVSYPGRSEDDRYEPTDYLLDQPYHLRPLTMRESLALSCNVTTVRWAHRLGPDTVVRFARAMGVESPLEPSLPLALGAYEMTPLELARSYCPLANGGFRVEPVSFVRIESRDGRTLGTVEPNAAAVIDTGAAYIVTDLLKDVLNWGTASDLRVGRPAAAKTGTSQDRRDAWMAGYTPDVVCVVWIGCDRPRDLGGYGGTLAGPLWADFIRRGLAGYPARDWARPPNVLEVTICRDTGLLPNITCPTARELYLRGTQPRERHSTLHWRLPWAREEGEDEPSGGAEGLDDPVPGEDEEGGESDLRESEDEPGPPG